MTDRSPRPLEFTAINSAVADVLKEIARRSELRQRLEAEQARPFSDDEFLELADRTGMKI